MCWFVFPVFVSAAKRIHWLLAPEEVTEEKLREWLPSPESGSTAAPKPADMTAYASGIASHGDAANVFESLDELDNAIKAANADLSRLRFHAFTQVGTRVDLGRCYAKLGRMDDAERTFKEAIAEAQRCRILFFELFAHRDYIVYVLDAAGRREEHLPALGACIKKLACAPSEYNAILGAGIDAEAAVAVAADG